MTTLISKTAISVKNFQNYLQAKRVNNDKKCIRATLFQVWWKSKNPTQKSILAGLERKARFNFKIRASILYFSTKTQNPAQIPYCPSKKENLKNHKFQETLKPQQLTCTSSVQTREILSISKVLNKRSSECKPLNATIFYTFKHIKKGITKQELYKFPTRVSQK